MILKSLVTTVATPRKKCGRDAPSITEPKEGTSTKVPVPVETFEEGYISDAVGVKTRTVLALVDGRVDSAARSAGRVRGYESRSS